MDERILSNPTAKRNLLYSDKTDDAERNAAADRFIEEERFGEALEFLEITRDADRLAKIEAIARERGDSFLLTRVEKIGGEELGADEWIAIGEKAKSLGKYYDAYRALSLAGEEEKAEALRAEFMPDYEPFRPEGK